VADTGKRASATAQTGWAGRPVALPAVDVPPPDPQKLLTSWMEWERGEVTPGRVLANLKTAGMREVLEQLAGQTAQQETPAAAE
jgi:hypothetical protein